MDTIDKDLVKELTAAKKAPRSFAIVLGGSECALVLAPNKVNPAKLKEAKEKTGGGRALEGRCFMEDGVMVFELEGAPPGGLEKKIKDAVKNNANLSLNVLVRQAPKAADEPAPPNGAAKEAETAPDLASTFKARLKELTPAYQATAKTVPAQKAALDQIVTQVMAAAKAQDYPQALAHLDRLEGALQSAKQASAAPSTEAATFKERFKVLTPRYQDAAKTAPSQKPMLDKIVAQVMAAAKAQNFVVALAELDQLEAALRTAKQASAAPDSDASAFKDRLKALTPEYQAAAKAAPAQKAALDALVAQAMAAAKARDYQQGLTHLDKLEAALKSAKPAAAPGASAAAFKERLKGLTPSYQQALQADAKAKPVLEKSIAQVMTLAKAANFEEALKKLDTLDGAIKAVLARAAKAQAAAPAPDAAPPTDAPPTEEEAANAELAAEFESLLKTLRPKFNKIVDALEKSSPTEAAELREQLAKALAANQAGNVVVAYDLLTTLDARLTTLQRSAKASAEIRKAAGPENVAFLVSKQEWDKVRQKARVELTKFQQAVLNDPETKADPRYEEAIVPTVNGLGKVLDSFDDQLNAVLDEAATLPAERKGPAIEKALTLIGQHRQTIEASEVIAAIDSGVYGSVSVGGSLLAALDVMAARLSKRLKA